jgi:hypothetical protein
MIGGKRSFLLQKESAFVPLASAGRNSRFAAAIEALLSGNLTYVNVRHLQSY